MPAAKPPPPLRYKGAAYLRHRLVLSILSSRPVRVTSIRPVAGAPGLSPPEVSLLRLLDKLTTGTRIDIDETGTALSFRPGLLLGGTLVHECHPARGLGYYLEALLMLAPFTKLPLAVTLRGATHTTTDLSVDSVAAVSVPLLRRLTLARVTPTLRVVRRAAAGHATGEVVLAAKPARGALPPVELIDAGLIKRVRGSAWANRVSPGYVNRMVDSARGVFNALLADVFLFADAGRNREGGAGYGCSLMAESTTGCLLVCDWAHAAPLASSADDAAAAGAPLNAAGGGAGGGDGRPGLPPTPEAVARGAAHGLLEEVDGGGCVDSSHANLALLICAAAEADVSRVRLGRLGGASAAFLRDIRAFLGVVFKVRVERDERMDRAAALRGVGGGGSDDEAEAANADAEAYVSGIVMTCVGVGLEGPRARS